MSTDLELFDRWCEGDQNAGNQLFMRYFDSICRFFESKVQGDIDDIVQTTFLACVRSRDRFRKQSSFRTYLFTIARHELYRYLRRRQRDRNAIDFGVTSLLDLDQSTPTSRIARQERHELLLHALCTLPLEHQLLLELHYWEDMNAGDLAEVFEIPRVTARTRLHRSRQMLQKAMRTQSGKPLPDIDGAGPGQNLDDWARSLRDRKS